MRKSKSNKAIQNLKLFFIILIIIVIAFSQVFQTRNFSNKLSPKDILILSIYIFGMIFIPLLAYYINKFREKKE